MFVCANNIKYIKYIKYVKYVKYVEKSKFKISVLETRQLFPLYTHYTIASYQRNNYTKMLTLIATWNRYNCRVCGESKHLVAMCSKCGTTCCHSNSHGYNYKINDNDCFECIDREYRREEGNQITILVNDDNMENVVETTVLEENDIYDDDEGIEL